MNLKTQKFNDVLLDSNKVKQLSERLGLNEKLVELLVLRGYDNIDAINVFLHPDEENFYDPMLMLGMRECCERLESAIRNGENVVVYGDYDADGICASAILSLYLTSRGLNVMTHIPDRIGEGYGLNVDSIERLIEENNPDLILTCDCGISAVEEVEYALDLGIDIIVTDHHEVGERRPECVVVNPHQPECKYPFKELCGAGVALKIVQALGGTEAARNYYDLASIATIADLVSLTDENRLIVQLGLASMPKSSNLGIQAIIEELKLKAVTSSDIAFKIAPRINAAGRMGSAFRAYELFTSDDPEVISDRLKQIIDANNARKTLCDELYNSAIAMLKNENLVDHRAIIITSDEWEKGITGILAARLVSDFKRPVFVIVKNNEEYKGTCRSIDGINIYELLSQNSDLLKEFGGHNQAAGFTILPENIEEFKTRILEQLSVTDIDEFIPSLKYDMELDEYEVTRELASSLELLEPTGNNGNPRPLFMTRTSSLVATPLKTNPDHTILKTENGLQFFAYNSYKLNTFYNGSACREMIYELVDNDYSPRLYLRGCAIDKLAVNDTLAKAGYLRMLNYVPSDKANSITYAESELDGLIDNPFGILLIAGCKATYDKFSSTPHKNIVLHEIFNETMVNVYSRLIVSPEFNKTFMLANYNKVIFLDSPPSDAVVSYINRHTDATVYVPEKDNKRELFSCVSADRAVFGRYFNAIKSNPNVKAPNIYAYFKALRMRERMLELPQFVACLSVFIQLGLMVYDVRDGKITVTGRSNDLSNSAIYGVIEAWQS
ncbi:MAG: single-stranded-DNA-specific exonuclease RecJ [Clostridiales bacterium]|nr:single-stranded-DNA-specific exonuclease RecJ [Clostridiales bacterium]